MISVIEIHDYIAFFLQPVQVGFHLCDTAVLFFRAAAEVHPAEFIQSLIKPKAQRSEDPGSSVVKRIFAHGSVHGRKRGQK